MLMLIAISDHCGVLVQIATDVIKETKKQGIDSIPIVAGGFIEEKDKSVL